MPDRWLELTDFDALASAVLTGDQRLRLTANGWSMRPWIHDGDVLEVKSVAFDSIHPGQVVLCRLARGQVVAHRVLALNRAQITASIQGDAQSVPDGSVSFQDILGRVVLVIHQGVERKLDTPWMEFIGCAWVCLAPLRNLVYRIHRKDRGR